MDSKKVLITQKEVKTLLNFCLHFAWILLICLERLNIYAKPDFACVLLRICLVLLILLTFCLWIQNTDKFSKIWFACGAGSGHQLFSKTE